MNTSKQVNVMIGLLFVFLVGTLLYWMWDAGFGIAGLDVNARGDDAEKRQIIENAERGGDVFAVNCRNCHGMEGLAAQESLMLPGLPLNTQLNRPVDPETGLVDVGELMNRQNIVRDTIRCGRVDTLMPQWAEDQGGPLNDFLIEQLVTLITGAMPGLDPPDDPNAVSERGWEAAVEAADHADILEGKRLARAVGPEDTVLVLTDAQGITVSSPESDSLLRIDEEVVKVVDAPAGSILLDDVTADQTDLPVDRADELFRSGDIVEVGSERMRVVSASGDTLRVERALEGADAGGHRVNAKVLEAGDEILVERAAFGTQAQEHEEGVQLYAGPLEPPTGPFTGEGQEFGPCGQRSGAAAPAVPPTPIPIEGEVTMGMGDNFFQLNGQQSPLVLEVAVGQDVTINLVNNGQAVHNMHITGVDNTYDVDFCEPGADEPCSDPGAIASGGTGTITFRFDEPGTFDFRCDFHPLLMTGQILVTE
jgi:plastocyanin